MLGGGLEVRVRLIDRDRVTAVRLVDRARRTEVEDVAGGRLLLDDRVLVVRIAVVPVTAVTLLRREMLVDRSLVGVAVTDDRVRLDDRPRLDTSGTGG